jgi:hypothetical protein
MYRREKTTREKATKEKATKEWATTIVEMQGKEGKRKKEKQRKEKVSATTTPFSCLTSRLGNGASSATTRRCYYFTSHAYCFLSPLPSSPHQQPS